MKRLAVLPYVLSIFLSALLLFLMEPLMGRLLLPEHGGSPSVWNTCVVGFQSLLLIGYAFAHWSVQGLGLRKQMLLYFLLLVLSLLAMSFSLPAMERTFSSPVLSILLTLITTVGLPFTLLAANSSLVQRWYSSSGLGDPFWLYAASNGGSLIALLGYPLAFEPLFGLRLGWRVWVALYCIYIITSVACMVASLRMSGATGILAASPAYVPERRTQNPEPDPAEPHPSWSRAAGWTLRSAVASSLLLSVTMKITTDLASVPIFWVVPLSLYLLTFILAFSPRFPVRRWIVATFTAIGIAWSMMVFIYTIPFPVWLNLTALLGTVFFGSLLCHMDLAATRPSPRYLTHFYLWIALGGAVGGILNSLVAPLVFESVAEYPITLFLLTFLIHGHSRYLSKFPRERMRRLSTYMPALTTVAALAVTGAMILRHRREIDLVNRMAPLWEVIPLALIVFGLLLARHAGQNEFVVACLTIYLFTFGRTVEPIIAQQRSFFGVMRVFETPEERFLTHGTTVHGAQWKKSPQDMIPSRYYAPAGPFGKNLPRPDRAEIGVVGLGVGALAAFGQPGQRITFFEIDSDIEVIARRYFTYLRDTKSSTRVRIGDGRLLLDDSPDRSLDLLILDAFSSDAIPTHLLTREAIELYLRKVKAGGVIVVHISNRHLDLTRVFRGWATMEKRRVAIFAYMPTAAESAAGATAALAVAIAPDPAVLERLVRAGKWQWLRDGKRVIWTDDRINLLGTVGEVQL